MPTSRKTRKRQTATRKRSLSRGLGEQRGLGQLLLDTVENIIELMRHTQDPDRLKELNSKRIALSKEAGRLIDATLDASSAEYRSATFALEEAAGTIRGAIKGLEAVKDAILKAAKALELIVKVVSIA
ncbi:MAG: hypothetical protein E8D46_16355 [Nitrospira sp.]|nr:MAG: hypothetical protein E8D46_16355 [Nitrospira sp.]